jgi:hypothetical protein
MTRVVFVRVDLEALPQLWLFCGITFWAGCSSSTGVTGIRPVPRPVSMRLANPTATVAPGTLHLSSQLRARNLEGVIVSLLTFLVIQMDYATYHSNRSEAKMDKLDQYAFPASLAFVGTIAVITLIVMGAW